MSHLRRVGAFHLDNGVACQYGMNAQSTTIFHVWPANFIQTKTATKKGLQTIPSFRRSVGCAKTSSGYEHIRGMLKPMQPDTYLCSRVADWSRLALTQLALTNQVVRNVFEFFRQLVSDYIVL